MLIRGRDGVLSLDLWEAELRTLRGQIAPIFYNRAGEVLVFPERFEHAIKKMTEAVNCVGCRHTHMAVPPDAKGVTV
jgi:hypothetical protein